MVHCKAVTCKPTTFTTVRQGALPGHSCRPLLPDQHASCPGAALAALRQHCSVPAGACAFDQRCRRHHLIPAPHGPQGYHKAGKISSSAFRLILDKASRKVLESLTAAGGGRGVGLAPDGRSLDVKRKDKIKVLVEQYVKKHGNAAASGGSGAPGASSAGGSMQPQPPPPPLGGSSGASAGVAPAPPAAPPPAPPPPPPPPPAAPVMQQPGASVMPPQLPGLMPPGLGPAPLGMAQGGMMVPTGFGVPPGLGMPSGAFPGMVQQGLPAAMPPGLMGSGPGGGGFDPHARVAQPPPPPPPQY